MSLTAEQTIQSIANCTDALINKRIHDQNNNYYRFEKLLSSNLIDLNNASNFVEPSLVAAEDGGKYYTLKNASKGYVNFNESVDNYDEIEFTIFFMTTENGCYNTDVVRYNLRETLNPALFKNGACVSYKNVIWSTDSKACANFAYGLRNSTSMAFAWNEVGANLVVAASNFYGIRYVNPNNYSTEEKVIGNWIDGKPLYQKTIDCGVLPSSVGTKVVQTGLTNATIVSFDGVMVRTSNGTYAPIPRPKTESAGQYVAIISRDFGSTIEISVGSPRDTFSAYVTIQYTKD